MYRFYFGKYIPNVKNLNVVQFFVKYSTKSECFIDQHLQRFNNVKACGSQRSGVPSTPINSEMNHKPDILIFLIIL